MLANGKDSSSQYLMLSNYSLARRQIPDVTEKITSSDILEFYIA